MPDYRNEYPPGVPFLAERGYAVVQFDVRGTGSSSGYSTDIYAPEERQDAYDMVAWIAAQPWCTGVVGMIGKSYGAVVQWQVAVQRPPALKAIVLLRRTLLAPSRMIPVLRSPLSPRPAFGISE